MSAKTLYDARSGIYTSSLRLPPIPEKSLYEYLTANVDFATKTVAFVEHKHKTLKDGTRETTARSITHGELKLQAQRLGHGLVTRAGLRPGDVVMILGTNSIEWVTVMLAAQFAGLVVALASPAYGIHELRHVYRLAKPKRVFLPTKLLIKATQVHIPWKDIVTYDVDAGMPEIGFIGKIKSSDEVAQRAQSYIVPNLADVTAFLPFSSGTTGLPKGVEITHRNAVAMMTIVRTAAEIYREPTRLINCLPFFHAMALLLHVCLPISLLGTTHIQVPFDAKFYLSLIKSEKIEQVSIVPPLLVLFGQMPEASQETFAHVRFLGCGAAPLAAETQKRIADKLGCAIVQGYGMTESTVGLVGLHEGTALGTCGRLMPGIEAKVVDPETGELVSPGGRGELWFRGPNIMKGYYQNTQATEQTKTHDGWLKTGDVGIVSDDGDFSVVDRIKELIKYKGSQIAPAELEALILTHSKVASAGVVGIYDEAQATELPRAYVQLKPGVSVTGAEREIEEHVRKHAGSAKWLRGGVRLVDVLPVTPSGKILRKELRLLVKAEMDGRRASRL